MINRVMVIAGEASGDFLAAELVRSLRQALALASTPAAAAFQPEVFGAGGPQMAAAGVELEADLTAHSVIGLAEALVHYSRFKQIFDRLLAAAIERQPDLIILVDFSGFNRRFAAAVRKVVRSRSGPFHNWNPRIVYYVSPQVWASRPGRAREMARNVDVLFTLFPFEKAWYAQRLPGLKVEFVGHPLVDLHAGEADLRTRVGSRPATPLVLLLPGSRRGEIRRHVPAMIEAAARVVAAQPARCRMVLPDEGLATQARALVAESASWLEIQTGGLASSLAEADVAIASTGTVTLECAYFGVPTVAIYKTSWSTYQIAKRLIHVKFVAMPNLLAGEAVYPELLQRDANGDRIAREVLDLLKNERRRTEIKLRLSEVVASLGGPGASSRAAAAILKHSLFWRGQP